MEEIMQAELSQKKKHQSEEVPKADKPWLAKSIMVKISQGLEFFWYRSYHCRKPERNQQDI